MKSARRDQALGKLGYEVTVVRQRAGGAPVDGRREYDAVLMDCRCPRMDGLRRDPRNPRREGGTAISRSSRLTAAAMQGDREACFAAGMDRLLDQTHPSRSIGRDAHSLDHRR